MGCYDRSCIWASGSQRLRYGEAYLRPDVR